jgi:hypothetical protein
MEEMVIKLDVPPELKDDFKFALSKAIRDFEIDLRFSLADKILSKSKLTDEQVKLLSNGLKERVAKRRGL